MSIRNPRAPLASLAAVMAVALSILPTTVTATDPSPSVPEAADALPQSPPTVHAEMLADHAADTPATGLPAGEVPAPIGGLSVQGDAGGTAGLSNALEREVYGYLPYWALSDSLLQYLRYDLVSTIAYFGVPAQSNGTLLKSGTGWNGWASAAMTGVINEAHANGVGVHLTVTMMAWSGDYAPMSTLLNSPDNRTALANDIVATVVARNADGVNLDFEPVPNSLEAAYVAFVRELKAALVASGGGSYLTVAATGGAASWNEGYDLAGLTADGAADAIMAMGYDFNWSGSTRAGGVSPLDSPYVLDVREAMADYLAVVPASKLIWGVPYYGRAWTTQTETVNSLTCKSASICPSGIASAGAFGRTWVPRYVDALEAVATHGRRWDATGQEPWYTYHSATYGTHVQGYYEDAESLRAKYALVEAGGLRGIGIWHLLMDVQRAELWSELARSFANLPFSDIAASRFLDDIRWLAEAGITTGCGDGRFCPTANVGRDQMASFLARAKGLQPADRDYFVDDAFNVHQDNINRVAAAGITVGCAEGRYCPHDPVPRDQMASFLARALGLPPADRDYFVDDAGNVHEDNINRVAARGITVGCAEGSYCPSSLVTRQQMAAFLHRAFDP